MRVKEDINEVNAIPVMHYLWLGPPTRDNLSSIAGHDIAGPIQMAKALKDQKKNTATPTNPIKFWCLQTYSKSFEKEFEKAGVDIEVCAIEELLERERNDSIFAKHSKLITNLLKTTLEKGDKKSLVSFKDCFSLFLLATQGGYFLDTNVFPVSGELVKLPQLSEVKTARSGFQASNDFFMMFSPYRADTTMLKILEKWEKFPCLSGLHAFSIGKEIPFFDKFKQIPKIMGITKCSYKSYYMKSDVLGLFYWIEQYGLASNEFENYLQYGDINVQIPYPNSRKLLEPCSICYDANPKQNWPSMPFFTDKAFISDRDNIYFVDRKKGNCVLVYQGTTTLHDNFPHPLEPKLNYVTLGFPKGLDKIMKWVDTTQVSLPYIVNIDKCTILHQAVLLNKFKEVQSLLQAGANLKSSATYELNQFPNAPLTLHFTAKELADFVGHIKIKELIETYEPAETYEPMKSRQNDQLKEQPPLIEQYSQLSSLITHIRQVIESFKKRSFSFFSFNMMKKAILIEDALQRAESKHAQIPFNSLEALLNYKSTDRGPINSEKVMSLQEALNFCRLTHVPKTRTLQEIESLYKVTI